LLDWSIAAAAAQAAAHWAAQASLLSLPIGQAWAYLVSILALKAGLWLAGGYRPLRRRMRLDAAFGGLALGAFFALTVAMVAAPDARTASALSLAMSMAALLLAALHASFAVLASALHRHGVFAETVVIVGATEAAERLAVRAKRTGAAHVVAVVDDRRAQAQWRRDLPPICGDIDSLLAWHGLPEIDRIIVAVPPTSPASVRAILKRLRCAPNRIDLLLEDGDADLHAPGARRIAGVLAVSVAGQRDDQAIALIKRTIDLALGLGLLAVLAAPMAAIALAIKFDSPGPALFPQRRIGKNGRVFTAHKLRTMHWAPDAPWRPAQANERRITRLGRWLRERNIDDWPLLLNVIRGDMGLVGPRPHAADAQTVGCGFRDIAAEYPARHSVKPGMFGWAQLNGWREAPRTPACVRAHLKHDLDYIAHASVWLDLQLLVRALLSAFRTR
jgi:lipopolysaccharide/colanic/teichoic acid biosynthesis glycosyltransferase